VIHRPLSKHIQARQKYRTVRHIFNSLFGLWNCGKAHFRVFNLLLVLDEVISNYNEEKEMLIQAP